LTSTEDKFKEVLAQKKFQVEIEIVGKKKFAYLDDLKELDDLVKEGKLKIIEVIELKGDSLDD